MPGLYQQQRIAHECLNALNTVAAGDFGFGRWAKSRFVRQCPLTTHVVEILKNLRLFYGWREMRRRIFRKTSGFIRLRRLPGIAFSRKHQVLSGSWLRAAPCFCNRKRKALT